MTTEVWIGADGAVLDGPEGAVAVEINEVSDDGLTVERTYAILEGGQPGAGLLQVDMEDVDQTQGNTWDLWCEDEDGNLKLVDTLEEFWPAFELEFTEGDELFREVCHILELPVWDVAPTKLQNEVYAWLRKHSGAAEKAVAVPALETPGPFPTGEKREQMRIDADVRIRRWEQVLEDMLVAFYDRQMEVVLARLTGTKVRKGTRHWKYGPGQRPAEVKQIDVETVLQPQRWGTEIQGDAERTVLRLFDATTSETAADLGASPIGLDSPMVQDMVAAHVRRIMSSTEARSRQVMQVILDLEASEADLDEIVEAVRGTYEQRQIWAATTARTETTGAVNGGAFAAALEAGVTTKEWLSSRDELVRLTHRAEGGGDGQQVPLLAPFIIGGAPLMYPGDPMGPADQVINCRCTMLFDTPEAGADKQKSYEAEGTVPLLADGIARVYDQLGIEPPEGMEDLPAEEALITAMIALLDALRGHIREVKRASKPEQRDEALARAAEYRGTAVTLMNQIGGPSAGEELETRLRQAEAV